MKIGIDIDEVLADFMSSFVNYYNKEESTNIKRSDFESYLLWKTIGGTKESTIQRVYEFYNSPEFNKIRPVKDSQYSVNVLNKESELIVITSRPHEMHDKTIEWLDNHFPNAFSEIEFTNEWAGGLIKPKRKKDVCLDYKIDFLLEDSMDYAKECADNGTEVLLFDCPWNQEEKLPNKIKRVYSWNHALKEIYSKTN